MKQMEKHGLNPTNIAAAAFDGADNFRDDFRYYLRFLIGYIGLEYRTLLTTMDYGSRLLKQLNKIETAD